MSILRISKKAGNEEQAKVILDASMRIKEPLGQRTIFLTEEMFKNVDYSKNNCEKHVAEILRTHIPKWEEVHYLELSKPDRISWVIEPLVESVMLCYSPQNNSTALNQEIPLYWQGKNTTINFILSAHSGATMQEILPAIDNGPMKDCSNALQFLMLWHEIAHSLRSNEPQADLIATCISRQAFQNTSFIKFYSDVRAYIAFAGSFNDFAYANANWNIVEAIDYGLSLPNDVIDTLNEKNIIDIANINFQDANKYAIQPLKQVFKRYVWPKNYVEYINHERFIQICEDKLSSNTYPEGSKERAVLKRFQLASTRLKVGHEAYSDNSNEEINWQKSKAFFTFPKDVPECLIAPSSLLLD